jgi:hypothetical protein
VKQFVALDNIAERLIEDNASLSQKAQLLAAAHSDCRAKISHAQSREALQKIIQDQKEHAPTILEYPDIQLLIRSTQQKFTITAQVMNLTRIENAITGTELNSQELLFETAINRLWFEYRRLYQIKDGAIPGAFKWEPNEQDRQYLQGSLLDLQSKMIRFVLDHIKKIELNPNNVDSFIRNNEKMFESIIDTNLETEYEQINRLYYDTREFVYMRHCDNKIFTKTHQKTLSQSMIEEIDQARKKQDDYINELTRFIEETDQKLKRTTNFGSIEITMLLNSRMNKSADLDSRNKIRDILKALVNHQTIPVSQYRYLEKNLKYELRDSILSYAKNMITIEPGLKVIDELVDNDQSEFTASALRHWIRSMTLYIEELKAEEQNFCLIRLALHTLSRMLPKFLIVSFEKGNAEYFVHEVITYHNRDYIIIDILSGKHNDIDLFEEISGDYQTLLSGFKMSADHSLKTFEAEINNRMTAFRTNPTSDMMSSVADAIYQHKSCIQDYSLVFNTDNLMDHGDDLYRLFIEYEHTIHDHIGNNEIDSPQFIKNIEAFIHLKKIIGKSKSDMSVMRLHKFSEAKMFSDMHRLGVVDKNWILPTFNMILRFNKSFRQHIAKPFEIDWISSDLLMQHCLDRMLSNPKLSKREQGRLLSDDISLIIDQCSYVDPAIQKFHHLIFLYSQIPMKILHVEEIINDKVRSKILGQDLQNAILSVLKNHSEIIEINFGCFQPDESFLSYLINNNENLSVYRFAFKPNATPKVNASVLLHPVESNDSIKHYRSRLKIEESLNPHMKSFFGRLGKSKQPLGMIEQFRKNPLKLFASLNMSPIEVYKELVATDSLIRFSEFNTHAAAIYEKNNLSESFAQTMVFLACEDIKSDMKARAFTTSVGVKKNVELIHPTESVPSHQSLGLAARWLEKIPSDSPLFAQTAFEYFMLSPVEIFKTEALVWKKFVDSSKIFYSNIVHAGYHRLFDKLLKFPAGMISTEHWITLFGSYLRELELLNEYHHELILDNHFQLISRLFMRQDLVNILVKMLRQESVFAADYSLRSHQMDRTLSHETLSRVKAVNLMLVEYIQDELAANRFSPDLRSFMRDMSILTSNPIGTNSAGFVKGLIEYLRQYASHDMDFKENLNCYVSYIVSNKIAISPQNEIALLNQITSLPRDKLITVEKDIDRLIAIFSHSINLREDPRVPFSMKKHPEPCKGLYLYFVENQAIGSNHYDLLIKQAATLNALIRMLDNLMSLPSSAGEQDRKSIYLGAIETLRQIDLKPTSILSYTFSNPVYQDSSMVLRVKSFQECLGQDKTVLGILRYELKTHYGRIFEQMINICLTNMPSSQQRLGIFLNKAAQATRDETGNWAMKLLIEARKTSNSLFSFNTEIDLFFQKLSENPEILKQSTRYIVKKLAESLSVDRIAAPNLKLVDLSKV